MGLFDLFRKKPEPDLSEENELEKVLQKAASEPAFRPLFYKRLLSDKLIVLTAQNSIPDGTQTLEKDSQVSLVSFQDNKIPIFTSTKRIFDKGIIKEEVPFLEMNGRELLRLTLGATLILNPYSDHGKELNPSEIERLLNGTLLTETHKEITVQKETTVQIGQPARYPTEMINSLKILFDSKPSVKAAYLGWIYDASSGEPPHYLLGLDVDGDMKQITNEAGFTAQQYLAKDEMVDFMQISEGGLSDYFTKQTQAFYTR